MNKNLLLIPNLTNSDNPIKSNQPNLMNSISPYISEPKRIHSFFGSQFLSQKDSYPYTFTRPVQSIKEMPYSQNPSIEQRNFNDNTSNLRFKEPRAGKKCCCRKTHCNKLYCECYANDRKCKNCDCIECYNKAEDDNINEDNIEQKMNIKEDEHKELIIKETEAKKEVHNYIANVSERRGCTCTKSNCTKQYCECHKFNRKCTSACRCVNCLNFKQKVHFDNLSSSQFSVMVVNNEISFNSVDNACLKSDSFLNKKRERPSETLSNKKTELSPDNKSKDRVSPKKLFLSSIVEHKKFEVTKANN